jgi:hypothetical protein
MIEFTAFGRENGSPGSESGTPGGLESMSKESGYTAKDIYKVRISKGFVDADFGEGFMVEIWDFRTQRIVYGERFHDLERARRMEKEIKGDLEGMTLDRFQQSYLKRRP